MENKKKAIRCPTEDDFVFALSVLESNNFLCRWSDGFYMKPMKRLKDDWRYSKENTLLVIEDMDRLYTSVETDQTRHLEV